MAIISPDDLMTLVGRPESPAVSLYMPSLRIGDTEQNPIRFRKLLRMAEEQLVSYGMRGTNAGGLLEPAQGLLSDIAFWENQGDGLAIFIAPDIFRHYRLPARFREIVMVGERFHLKPLIPLLRGNGLFYVLAVSKGGIRFLQCTRDSIRLIKPEKVPVSFAEATRYEQTEKHAQGHASSMPGAGGASALTDFGYGAGSTNGMKQSVLRYLQQVDRCLWEFLHDEQAPLVLAGVDYIHAFYREANTYQHLLHDGITGNPDDISEKTLQEQALTIVERYWDNERISALKQYNAAAGTGLASSDPEQVIPAAFDGRIYTLFVALDTHQWGRFDPEQHTIELHENPEPGDEDLLDLAAVHTLTKRGSVYAVERGKVPEGSTLAAVFRY